MIIVPPRMQSSTSIVWTISRLSWEVSSAAASVTIFDDLPKSMMNASTNSTRTLMQLTLSYHPLVRLMIRRRIRATQVQTQTTQQSATSTGMISNAHTVLNWLLVMKIVQLPSAQRAWTYTSLPRNVAWHRQLKRSTAKTNSSSKRTCALRFRQKWQKRAWFSRFDFVSVYGSDQSYF